MVQVDTQVVDAFLKNEEAEHWKKKYQNLQKKLHPGVGQTGGSTLPPSGGDGNGNGAGSGQPPPTGNADGGSRLPQPPLSRARGGGEDSRTKPSLSNAGGSQNERGGNGGPGDRRKRTSSGKQIREDDEMDVDNDMDQYPPRNDASASDEPDSDDGQGGPPPGATNFEVHLRAGSYSCGQETNG